MDDNEEADEPPVRKKRDPGPRMPASFGSERILAILDTGPHTVDQILDELMAKGMLYRRNKAPINKALRMELASQVECLDGCTWQLRTPSN